MAQAKAKGREFRIAGRRRGCQDLRRQRALARGRGGQRGQRRDDPAFSTEFPGSQELRMVVLKNSNDAPCCARSVRCEQPYEPNPRWCSVALLPLR